ncbi:helix-turn-helix transcriptional regulator [Acetobacter fabarum]
MRKEFNMTQAELAEQVGVSRKTINTVENCVFMPSVGLAIFISQVFNKKVEDIFSISK